MKKRNYGIDLLKIVSMLFIVILHINLRGGILEGVPKDSLYYKFALILEIICLCAVNVYALISGYVSYSKYEKNPTEKYNFKRIIYLWLQVFFYGITIYLVVWLLGKSQFTYKQLFTVLFPVSTRLLWYFSAYALLFFFMPMINSFIKNTNNKILISLLIFIFLFFSLDQSLMFKVFGEFTFTNRGYSVWWLFILFYIGALIKKIDFGSRISTKKLIFSLIFLYIVSYTWKLYFPNILSGRLENFLYEYISPTNLLIAIIYLLLFIRIKINNNKIQKIILVLSTATFGAYVMHSHPYIWDKFNEAFVFILNYNYYFVPIIIIFVALILLMIMLLIDIVRKYVFEILKIDKLCEFLDKRINKTLDFIIKKFYYIDN